MHNVCFQSLSSAVGHTSPRLSKAGCPVLFNTPQLAVVLPDTRKLVYPFQMAVCSCYCDYVRTFIKCANVIRVGTGEPERQTSCAFTICIVAIIETNWVMSPPGMKNTQARLHAQRERGRINMKSCIHDPQLREEGFDNWWYFFALWQFSNIQSIKRSTVYEMHRYWYMIGYLMKYLSLKSQLVSSNKLLITFSRGNRL